MRESSFKIWVSVSCLGLTIFIAVTTSLMPMGLLPEIAEALHESESTTGLLVTGYAWACAILTLPLTMLCARFERRRLVFLVMLIFIVGHVLSALSSTFMQLMLSRLFTGASHAMLWGVATPAAVRLAPAGQSSKVLAIVAVCVACASILGVPLGTFLGHGLGWRAAFVAIALFMGLLFFMLLFLLPKMPSTNLTPLKNLSILIRRPALLNIYVLLALASIAHYACFTFFVPYMRVFAGFTPEATVRLLLFFGVSSMVGSIIAARFTDSRIRYALFFSILLLGLNFALASLAVGGGVVSVFLYCLIWGAAITGLILLLQSSMFSIAPEATDLAMSVYAIFFNVAIGLGAIIGGAIYDRFGVDKIPYAGALIAWGGLLVLWAGTKKSQGRGEKTGA